MKVIICGTRSDEQLSDNLIYDAIKKSGFDVTEVVEGGADGVDLAAWMHAIENGMATTRFDALWNKYGTRAGPIRNQQMVDYADALIAIPDKASVGTWDAVRKAESKGIPVYVHKALL